MRRWRVRRDSFGVAPSVPFSQIPICTDARVRRWLLLGLAGNVGILHNDNHHTAVVWATAELKVCNKYGNLQRIVHLILTLHAPVLQSMDV